MRGGRRHTTTIKLNTRNVDIGIKYAGSNSQKLVLNKYYKGKEQFLKNHTGSQLAAH